MSSNETTKATAFRKKESLNLICFGFVRNHFENENINSHASDIACLLYKHLYDTNWYWDYIYNKDTCSCDKSIGKRRQVYHRIRDNNKTFECLSEYCNCFGRCNIGMAPNCGIFKIKIRINQIENYTFNGIGITTNTNDNNNSSSNDTRWWNSNDYIVWTSENYYYCRYNLVCGDTNKQLKNTFHKKELKYESNNKYNINKLPCINKDDIIIMIYDSNKNELTFLKENDVKCNSTIKNLPKDKTCYWFVGHSYKPMIVTILE